jgi:hypothetical protein
MFANARKGLDRGVLHACTWPRLWRTLEPCQLSLYSFLTPKLVFHGHSSDENLKLLGNCTTASPWPHP